MSLIQYVITDGNGRYIKSNASGGYAPVHGSVLADRWNTKSKASNVLRSCINKNLRYKYMVEEIETPDYVSVIKNDPLDTIALADEKANEFDADGGVNKFVQDLSSFTEFFGAAENKRDELVSDLSQVDREVSDIYHYIENGKFNAYKGWLAFSLLQKTLKRRRKIKNELSVLNEFFKCNITSSSIEDVITYAKNVENRTYTPRVLTNLFQNT